MMVIDVPVYNFIQNADLFYTKINISFVLKFKDSIFTEHAI